MDDLLDLSWTDSKASAPKQLQPSASTSRQPTPSSQPTFDFLAKPPSGPNYYSTSTPPIRGSTPKTAPLPQQPRLPDATHRSNTPNPPAKPAANGDAFSSLFSLAGGLTAASSKTLSLADKQKQAEIARAEQAEKQRQQFEADGSFWDNLGSSSTAKATSSGSNNARSFTPFDDLLAPQPVRPSTLRQTHTPSPAPSEPSRPPTSAITSSAWDDDDTFLAGPSKPVARTVPFPQPTSETFNFDAFDDTKPSLAPPTRQNGAASSSGMRTPLSDFDFGDRGLDDDLLGELGQPANPVGQAQVS